MASVLQQEGICTKKLVLGHHGSALSSVMPVVPEIMFPEAMSTLFAVLELLRDIGGTRGWFF
jgi:hypothetical protein